MINGFTPLILKFYRPLVIAFIPNTFSFPWVPLCAQETNNNPIEQIVQKSFLDYQSSKKEC